MFATVVRRVIWTLKFTKEKRNLQLLRREIVAEVRNKE